MIALVDFDSIIYNSVYRVVSYAEIKEMLLVHPKEVVKEWFMDEVLNRSINRCENDLLKMQNYLSEVFPYELTDVELYITKCSNNFRKQLSDEYKAKRKRNNYVGMVRAYYAKGIAIWSDTLEADDLIADRAKEIGLDKCLVISIDKDLKTIGGYYWSYYQQKVKDENGEFIVDENGISLKEYKQKQVMAISPKDADNFFWGQMLMGDSADGIKGVKGIGAKRAEKLLEATKCNFVAVARQYLEKHTKQEFKTNYQLLKLGTR